MKTGSVTVGQGHGATVTRPYGGSVNVTVRYQASDPDSNLARIRPQVWHPSGYLNNNGGNFIGQSGGHGEVVWTVTLHSPSAQTIYLKQVPPSASLATDANGNGVDDAFEQEKKGRLLKAEDGKATRRQMIADWRRQQRQTPPPALFANLPSSD